MNINTAQRDIRDAFYGGATGVVVSGLVWLLAGILALLATPKISLIAFFVGGALIYPLSILLSKMLGRTGKPQEGNALTKLAIESTFLLFIGLFISFLVFQVEESWFYHIMLLIIGARYLLFQSIYGMSTYWLLGLSLIVAGAICLSSSQPFHVGAICGGLIEICLSFLIFSSSRF